MSLLYSYRCQCRPWSKQYKCTLQLNAALLKGTIHMHKHILCAHSSPQPVCSTSAGGHKDLALGEHYQSCNKAQGKLTAAGDTAKPLLETSTPWLSSLHRALCAPPNMEFSWQERKRLREQEAKLLFWFMGCGPEKQIALAHEITAQTLEHSLRTEWERFVTCTVREMLHFYISLQTTERSCPCPFRGN